MNSASEDVLVVVSHYNVRPTICLIALLDQVQSVPGGWPFRVRIVVNMGLPQPLVLPAHHRDIEVIYRPNTGYNIGAWDLGWRLEPAFAGCLFLQEECRLVRQDWVAAFVRKASEPGVGLVGECLSSEWDAPWGELARRFHGVQMSDHLIDGWPADRVPCYLDFLLRHGINPGARGDHLQSLVLFARREMLEAMGGFPEGCNYGEAIAAEIGISKKIQGLGLQICEVGGTPFTYIEHPQWLHRRFESQNGSTEE